MEIDYYKKVEAFERRIITEALQPAATKLKLPDCWGSRQRPCPLSCEGWASKCATLSGVVRQNRLKRSNDSCSGSRLTSRRHPVT